MPLQAGNAEMMKWIDETITKLDAYCLKNNYTGYDPYDGLESHFFKSIPIIRSSRVCRLLWIQLFKRNPFNLRRLLKVPLQPNAKTLALFLKAYCLQYQSEQKPLILDKINYFIRVLKQMKCEGYHGACWGYPFDWQSRSFFLRSNTPTSVCTSFVADALLDAYQITKDKELHNLLLTVPEFYLKDLHHREYNGKYCSLSYSPADYEEVYNVSYLVAASLSRIYQLESKPEWKELAGRLIRFGAEKQRADGLWFYGSSDHHQWADGFHTGYNLVSLHAYITCFHDDSQRPFLEKGFDCFLKYFTDGEGSVFYYHNGKGPMDAHNVAQAILTILLLGNKNKSNDLVMKIFRKGMKYLYDDEQGIFYFQKYKHYTNRIPYMRWSQAWMLLALMNLKNQWKLHEDMV